MIEAIPLASIDAGANDRTVFDALYIADLAADIQMNGLVSKAITVRPTGAGRYQIVEGECRTRAYRLLATNDPAYSSIPAIVRDIDDRQASRIMFAENFKRKNLDVIDEANAYRKRMERFGLTVQEVAAELGVSDARVRSRLKLLKLMPEAQHLVRHGNMPLGHAEEMSRLTKNFQLVAFRALSRRKGIILEDFRKVVNELDTYQSQQSMFDEVWFNDQQVIDQRVDEVLDKLTTSYFAISSNGCTIYVGVEHPASQRVEMDEDTLLKAIRLRR